MHTASPAKPPKKETEDTLKPRRLKTKPQKLKPPPIRIQIKEPLKPYKKLRPKTQRPKPSPHPALPHYSTSACMPVNTKYAKRAQLNMYLCMLAILLFLSRTFEGDE
jgi:hypothetical protein